MQNMFQEYNTAIQIVERELSKLWDLDEN
jgi:hypothetical protein